MNSDRSGLVRLQRLFADELVAYRSFESHSSEPTFDTNHFTLPASVYIRGGHKILVK